MAANRTAGSVVAPLPTHKAVNFWPSIVPVLPNEADYRSYAFVVAMLVPLALGLTSERRLWCRQSETAIVS